MMSKCYNNMYTLVLVEKTRTVNVLNDSSLTACTATRWQRFWVIGISPYRVPSQTCEVSTDGAEACSALGSP